MNSGTARPTTLSSPFAGEAILSRPPVRVPEELLGANRVRLTGLSNGHGVCSGTGDAIAVLDRQDNGP